MRTVQSIHDADLGEITFHVHPHARHISIRFTNGKVRVTLPSEASYQKGIDFLNEKRALVLEKKKTVHNEHFNSIIDEAHPLHTLTFTAQIIPSNRVQLFFQLKEGVLFVYYPKNQNVNSNTLQKAIGKGIVYFMRKAAKQQLPARLKQLSTMHGLTFKTIRIRSSKTRWGSCSHQNNINLSLYLMLLPSHLIDYVILHELCHTVEHNHSAKFWKALNGFNVMSEAYRQELKNYHIPSYL